MKRTIQSLNGQWSYSINGKDAGFITVPFSARCVGDSLCSLTFDAAQKAPHTMLCFEGITYEAVVTLNGTELGKMVPYSYYAFDVTDLLLEKGNRLSVALKDMNLPFGPSEGWENYGGIIREVYLTATDEVWIDDIIWRTEVAEDVSSATGSIQVLLGGGESSVCAVLTDRYGFEVARGCAESKAGKAELALEVIHPNLWSPDSPYLYTLTVYAGEDSVTQRVGFKTLVIKGQRFYLNGQPLFFKGICRHDMWGEQGHTLTEEQMIKDMKMIKATGCNFVRLVHYPHHRRIVEIADEIGLMVSEEPGLWWSDMHNPDTVAGALQVMERVVKRDRNRVSMAFWLCFNECIFTPEFLEQSSACCRLHDPTRYVSGANCMSIEKTKEEFPKYGFDFYTQHPYGLELDHVSPGPGRSGTLDGILEAYSDKPTIFTEWGGLYVFENPKLFERFQRYMLDAWRKPDGDKVLAGCCYWVWADMFEFGRGEHACFDGILCEGLVDIHRNTRVNLDLFARLYNGDGLVRDEQKKVTITPFLVPTDAMSPVDVWANADEAAQQALYSQMLADSTPQAGYYHKKNRRLTHGPALPEALRMMGRLPVNIRAGQPLVIKPDAEMVIPVGKSAKALYFIGNVSMPYGYPAYGVHGEKAAEYELCYEDGSRQIIPLRNGVELTTALASIGPSRIEPTAPALETAVRYSYDLNWEHFVIQLFEAAADCTRRLESIRVRVTNPAYTLLLYGITAQVK